LPGEIADQPAPDDAGGSGDQRAITRHLSAPCALCFSLSRR
jgi:hypothetical protein